jgi:Outer membrane protein beta-barrel domain
MNWKRLATIFALVAMFSVPAQAGSFGVYGSYWDSDQASHSTGGGARVGFTFVKFLELDFHGTYYSDFKTDVGGQSVDVKAKPVDGGLRVNLLPGGPLNPFVGAGATYYFLDTSQGSIQSKTGIYGQAGLEFGGAGPRFFVEALWRRMESHLDLASFDTRTRFDGFAANAGFTWRWGR